MVVVVVMVLVLLFFFAGPGTLLSQLAGHPSGSLRARAWEVLLSFGSERTPPAKGGGLSSPGLLQRLALRVACGATIHFTSCFVFLIFFLLGTWSHPSLVCFDVSAFGVGGWSACRWLGLPAVERYF